MKKQWQRNQQRNTERRQKHHREPGATAAEVKLETCPACTAAVGSEKTCTQCGADLDYYRQPAPAALAPADSEQTGEANTEKASE